MKELSTKEIILPIVVVLIAVIIVTVISVAGVNSVKKQCKEAYQESEACEELLTAKEKSLGTALSQLNITEKDLKKYDEIYEEKKTEAEVLMEQLVEEQNKPPEEISVCEVPYRSVPSYEAFSKAARLELLLERLDNAEAYLEEYQYWHEDELRTTAGYLYFISMDFKSLFHSNGVKVPLGQKGQDLYIKNTEILEELEMYYHSFDQFTHDKLRTKLPQIIKLQRSVIKGMQANYFM